MTVDKNTEHYLINSMGLSKVEIKRMLPSEVDEHCNKVIKDRIQKRGVFKPKIKS